jgi:hypothetical protein
MTGLAALAPFLWWIMLLSSTAIILHDLATIAFGTQPSQTNVRAIRTRARDAVQSMRTNDLGRQKIDLSSTGFQKEAAATILEIALAARNSPLTKIPDSKLDVVDELLSDPQLKEFVRTNSKRSTQKIDKKNLKNELIETYSMLERAERIFR